MRGEFFLSGVEMLISICIQMASWQMHNQSWLTPQCWQPQFHPFVPWYCTYRFQVDWACCGQIFKSLRHGWLMKATSHMSQEPWPWNCESPKESVQRPSNTPPKSCSVVTDPQLYCEVICDWVINQMLFQWICIHAGPHTWKDKINQWLWTFGMPWSPGFVLGLPPRGGFWK